MHGVHDYLLGWNCFAVVQQGLEDDGIIEGFHGPLEEIHFLLEFTFLLLDIAVTVHVCARITITVWMIHRCILVVIVLTLTFGGLFVILLEPILILLIRGFFRFIE